jgi:hypothetical protein
VGAEEDEGPRAGTGARAPPPPVREEERGGGVRRRAQVGEPPAAATLRALASEWKKKGLTSRVRSSVIE